MTNNDVALAVDIGATKIAGCLVNAAGAVLERRVRPTDGRRAEDEERVWRVLAGLVHELFEAASDKKVIGIGVGSAGPLDLAQGKVSPINIPAWREFPLVERLAGIAPTMSVYLAGDGICAAAGEHWQGAARGLDDVLAIVVSTGVGGGLIQGGRLFAGRSGNAGHIGHVVVDLDGDRCPCGSYGCVEATASGPSMVAWARRNGWRPGDTSSTAVELAADARKNDRIAVEVFRRAAGALAAGAVSAAALCDLTHVVVGGGVANAADLLFPPLQAAYDRYAQLGFLRGVKLKVARLANAAGLVGAAALVFNPDRYGGPGVLHRAASG